MAAHEGTVHSIGYSKEAKTVQLHALGRVPEPSKTQIPCHSTAKKMVTDITYISDGTNFHYLSVIQDLFNSEVVAWQLSARNDVQLMLDTVEQWTNISNSVNQELKFSKLWKSTSTFITTSDINLN